MAELKNPKHELFCREYIVDYNGTQAAIRAAYSPGSAANTASRLLTNEEILARVRELQKEQMQRLSLNADMVILEILDTYRSCRQGTPVLQRNQTTGKWEEAGIYQFDSHGALKALELLGKHLGVFEKKPAGGDKGGSNLLEKLLEGTGGEINTEDVPELQ